MVTVIMGRGDYKTTPRCGKGITLQQREKCLQQDHPIL